MKTYQQIIALSSLMLLSNSLTAQIDTSSTVVIVAGQEAALAYNKGISSASVGDFDQALRDFTSAIESNSQFPKARYNRGVMELDKFLNKAAVADFDAAIAIDPKTPSYHLGRAIALARMGQYEPALESIRKAEKRGYSPTLIKYFYGYIYFLQGKYTDAARKYSETISSSPRFAYAYCDRATAHLKAGNYKAALDDYNTALEIMPSAHFVYLLRADAKAAQGNYNAAIQDINAAISIMDGNKFDGLIARGVMYGRASKYQKAMADFNACIALNPESPIPYICIGNMLMSQNKHPEAEAQYTKAIDIDPDNIAAYNNRANAKEFQFNLSGAKADRDKAKTLLNNSNRYIK